MNNYFYMTKEGKFVDSSHRMDDPELIQISEAQYHVSRLVIKGYSQKEIIRAVNTVFNILQGKDENQG